MHRITQIAAYIIAAPEQPEQGQPCPHNWAAQQVIRGPGLLLESHFLITQELCMINHFVHMYWPWENHCAIFKCTQACMACLAEAYHAVLCPSTTCVHAA